METFVQDLRYALRALRKTPGFTLVAVLTLALGIGANTAIFSVVYGVLLRPLPFPEPDELVLVHTRHEGDPGPMSAPDFIDVRSENRVFEDVAAWHQPTFNLSGAGEPVRLQGAAVTAGFFEVFGARPELGRTIRADENDPGNASIVLLSHALWQGRFGGDPRVVGRSLTLDNKSYVVVGVMPEGFAFPPRTELWTPIPYDKDFLDPENRRAEYLGVIARLRPGVALERAAAEVATIARRLELAYPQSNTNVALGVTRLHEEIVGDIRTPLLVLLGAVGLVLLIACTNVMNLLLARAAAREGEVAVRAALGAGRRRLLRQLLTESLVLALAGGALGIVLAAWGTELLVDLQPKGFPRLSEVRVDGAVLAFTAAATLATALVFGTLPALRATRSDLAPALKRSGRGALAGRGGIRVRSALVVAETALAVVLLVGAGLLLRSFVRLLDVDPGFRAERTLSFQVALPDASYPEDEQVVAFYDRLLERLEALPGVVSSGGVIGLPLTDVAFILTFEVEGRPTPKPGEFPAMQVRTATPKYFETMGIRVLRGRSFTEADRAGAPQVLVLSEPAVRRFFPDEDPIGKRITLGWGRPDGTFVGGEVVGIVGAVKDAGLDDDVEPEVYIPHLQVPVHGLDLVVRTRGDPLALAGAVRREVSALDPNLPVSNVRTLEQIVRESISQPRFYLLLLTLFAGVALLLAAVGIFGVLSYAVAQRTREIGIRVALGAEPAAVLRDVVARALRLTAAGLTLGLVGALAVTRVLTSLLFGVTPTDPPTFLAVAATLAAVALAASYLPARAATRVDPVTALRTE